MDRSDLEDAIRRAFTERRYADFLRLQEALEGLGLDRHDPGLVVSRIRLSRVLRFVGRLEEAREVAEEAVRRAEAIGGWVLADALDEHALDAGPREAEVLVRALAHAEGHPQLPYGIRLRLANVLDAAGDLRGAQRVLDEARAIAEPGGPTPKWYVVQARVHQRSGDLDGARAAYAEAEELAVGLHDALGRAHAVVGLGEIAMAAGDPEQALEQYLRAAAILDAIGVRYQSSVDAWSGAGDAARALGDLDRADACYRRAASLLDGSGPKQEALELNVAQVAIARGRWDDAARILRALWDRGTDHAVLQTVARAGLAAVAAHAGDETAFREAFRPFVAAWQDQPVERDVAWLTGLAASDAARRGWLAHAVRARRLALDQSARLGNPSDARGHLRALRRLADRNAPVPLGPFLLDRRIGKGSFGEVWRAEHESGTPVAIKVISAEEGAAALLDNEVRAMAWLDHPNVLRLLHHGHVDRAAATMEPSFRQGSPWIATELATGGTVREILGRVPWPQVRLVLLAVLDALAHAHARGVLHLDLKPANVLLDDDRPMLADFGLASVLGTPGRPRAGTPLYMAPEQFGAGGVGPWTDLYALGCLATALVSGGPPFQGSSREAIRRAHLAEAPRLEPAIEVPSGFAPWVRRLLAKDPERRFRRAADAALALLSVHGAAAGPTGTPSARGDDSTLVLPPSEEDAGPIAVEADDERCAVRWPSVPWTWTRPPAPARPELAEAGLGLFGLRRPPFVGRRTERDHLWTALREVHATGRVVVVRIAAEPGLGATALIDWLCGRAHEVGAAEVVRDPPPEERERLFSATRPVLVTLDPGVDEAAAWAGRPARVLAVATGRQGPADLVLGPLDDADTGALLAGLLPLAPVARDVLVRRVGGHPGFAVELLTDLVERDRLVPGPAGWRLRSDGEPLPATRAGLASARARRKALLARLRGS